MIREKSCGAVVYTTMNKERKYLIVRMHLGHYGFSKGHVEKDETEVETALREIKEETNLNVQIDTNFRTSTEYSPYEECMKEVVYYVATTEDTNVICQPEEISEIQWVSYEEALDLLTYENDKEILRKVKEYLDININNHKIIFVRHGKDDDNYRGGWSELDLIDEGIEQAKQLMDYLNDNYKISKIVSSDLQRAMTTAKIISEKLELPVIPEKQLREMNNGDLAGMLNSEALKKYPGIYFSSLEMDECYPNGESPFEFYQRIKLWFNNFLNQINDEDSNVLVVTHGGVINIIYHLVNQLEWNNKNKPVKVANCSVHVLNLKSMKFEIENRTDYLVK